MRKNKAARGPGLGGLLRHCVRRGIAGSRLHETSSWPGPLSMWASGALWASPGRHVAGRTPPALQELGRRGHQALIAGLGVGEPAHVLAPQPCTVRGCGSGVDPPHRSGDSR